MPKDTFSIPIGIVFCAVLHKGKLFIQQMAVMQNQLI